MRTPGSSGLANRLRKLSTPLKPLVTPEMLILSSDVRTISMAGQRTTAEDEQQRRADPGERTCGPSTAPATRLAPRRAGRRLACRERISHPITSPRMRSWGSCRDRLDPHESDCVMTGPGATAPSQPPGSGRGPPADRHPGPRYRWSAGWHPGRPARRPGRWGRRCALGSTSMNGFIVGSDDIWAPAEMVAGRKPPAALRNAA